MNQENQPIPQTPIIEAVVDIDCDLPPKLDLQNLREPAANALRARYPKFRRQMIHQHVFKQEGKQEPEMKTQQCHGAMQFLSEDERQLVQFRPNGFSFNRLAPYTSLDDYFPEIESTWQIFLELAQPVVIRKIGIRMINRIILPMEGSKIELERYLKVPPRLPDTGSPLLFLGFLDQQMAVDPDTKNRANIVKTAESPQGSELPIILDIDVFRPCELSPSDESAIRSHLDSLRSLKNRIFRNTLTPQCLNLFSLQD